MPALLGAQSWEDDAEVRDRARSVYADPAKLRPVSFDGVHHRGHGIFAVPPTPQRTPVLFQAGTSDRGRAFAARNAEAVFIQGQSIAQAAAHRRGHPRPRRSQRVAPADDIAVVSGVTVIVAPTSEEARRRAPNSRPCYALDDAAVMFAGFTGLDLTRVDPDTLLEDVVLPPGARGTDPARSVRAQGSVRVRDVLDQFRAKAIRGFQVTGSPVEVADETRSHRTRDGLDGFMLEPTFGGLGCSEDFIELVAADPARSRTAGGCRGPDAPRAVAPGWRAAARADASGRRRCATPA